MNLLEDVIQTILEEKLPAEKYRDHSLTETIQDSANVIFTGLAADLCNKAG